MISALQRSFTLEDQYELPQKIEEAESLLGRVASGLSPKEANRLIELGRWLLKSAEHHLCPQFADNLRQVCYE